MAAATEIERLVVRLVGDGSQYQKTLKQAREATEKYARDVNNRLRDARGRFVAEQGKIRATLAQTAVILKTTGAAFTKFASRVRRAGRRMVIAFTLPLTIIGGLAVRAFAKFDKAMIESTSIMKVTTQQTEKMRDAALELSSKAIQGPSQLAESYFFLASAGKNAEQSIALLPKVAKFATAGAFDMALATDLLTDAQSALGLSSKNVAKDTENLARVADVLVKANTLANASVQQFSIALTSKAGAALKAYNKDVEEGVAVLAALADQGVKAELAGNALDRVIRLSTKGALDNAKAHAQLGFRVFDATGKMRNLGDIIANLEDVLEGMSDRQRAATLGMLGFEARVQGVILPLLGTSDAIKEYEKQLRNAKGITDEVANKQMKAFSNQLQILKNQLTLVGIEIGQVLEPVISFLNEKIRKGVEIWKGFSKQIKQLIVGVGIAVAVIGPLLIVFGTMLAIAGAAATTIGTLVGWIAAISLPVIAAVAAITILGGAVLAAAGTVASFIIDWKSLFKAVREFVSKSLGFLRNFNDNIAILWRFIKRNWKGILFDMARLWITIWSNMLSNLVVVIKTFGRLWVSTVGFVASLVQRLFTIDFVGFVFKGISKAVVLFVKFATFVGKKLLEALNPFAKKEVGGIQEFLGRLSLDLEKGVKTKTLKEFLAIQKEIIKQGARELKFTQGFESSLKGPQFKFGDEDKEEEKTPIGIAARKARRAAKVAKRIADRNQRFGAPAGGFAAGAQQAVDQAQDVAKKIAPAAAAAASASEQVKRKTTTRAEFLERIRGFQAQFTRGGMTRQGKADFDRNMERREAVQGRGRDRSLNPLMNQEKRREDTLKSIDNNIAALVRIEERKQDTIELNVAGLTD